MRELLDHDLGPQVPHVNLLVRHVQRRQAVVVRQRERRQRNRLLERLHAAGLEVNDDDKLVLASDDEAAAVAADGHVHDAGRGPDGGRLSGCNGDLLHELLAARAIERLAVLTPRHSVHGAAQRMHREAAYFLAVQHVPENHFAPRAHQHLLVGWRPRHERYHAHVRVRLEPLMHRSQTVVADVPDDDVAVCGGGGEAGAAVGELDDPDLVAVLLENGPRLLGQLGGGAAVVLQQADGLGHRIVEGAVALLLQHRLPQ
mmetsp:Transcript_21858/g.85619  ORF Transcript_21858/g.85619 Transcript_21858/m.85619 type:complete len:258 (+) Transcript_21858:2481-3254(+)